MSLPDLKKLPAVSFAPLDSARVEREIFRDYEMRTESTLYPGDPVRLFMDSLAWAATVQNHLIDLAGRQNLLAFASGANLDHLGALMGVARIPAQPARCIVRFALPKTLPFAVPVPAGTRVTTRDGKAVFATAGAAEIPPGETFADILVLCLEAGAAGSGLLPGQIECLIDPVPYISAVANLDASAEGADLEDDERLRGRIRLAPESFTVAGSVGQYEARTLAVSADIAEVSVHSPEPGVVDVRFVLKNGELPDAAMISLVQAALSAEDVRPLTDRVLVGAPDPVFYSIRGSWQVKRSDAPMLATIAANVEKAVEEYRLWQRARPGRDIVPSRLVALVQDAGAKRVQVEEPVFTRISGTQIARENIIEMVFAGLEEE